MKTRIRPRQAQYLPSPGRRRRCHHRASFLIRPRPPPTGPEAGHCPRPRPSIVFSSGRQHTKAGQKTDEDPRANSDEPGTQTMPRPSPSSCQNGPAMPSGALLVMLVLPPMSMPPSGVLPPKWNSAVRTLLCLIVFTVEAVCAQLHLLAVSNIFLDTS